ncbi:MAG: hypothetical protein IH977_05630 [Nitrospinae bacterium]|nr:hypothetical protein [Nitrospinota bacterium]
MLHFNASWRLTSPTDGNFHNRTIPPGAVEEFNGLIMRLATQGNRKEILEHFKKHFCYVVGTTYYPSSNESWAESDLQTYMDEAAGQNAPLFIEAFFDACEILRNSGGQFWAPDAPMINQLLDRHRIGYQINPPNLVLRESEAPLVEVPDNPPTLAGRATEVFQTSLRNSERLLSEGHGREAVQETLWLLETVTTAFRGAETATGTVEGRYFNDIAKDLRRLERGNTFQQIISWMKSLHGFLSSPTGGGVRHGLDLNSGVELRLSEARLICNLLRSYLTFLLSEHERLTRGGGIH